MKLLNELWIKFNSKFIAEDEMGNKYYESNSTNYLGKKTRSVIYFKAAEPSMVPPSFHAWLHYLSDEVPKAKNDVYAWLKKYKPNMTGTNFAYSPLQSSERVKVSSDYKSWQPNKKQEKI